MFHRGRLKNGRKLLLDQRVVGGAEAAAVAAKYSSASRCDARVA